MLSTLISFYKHTNGFLKEKEKRSWGFPIFLGYKYMFNKLSLHEDIFAYILKNYVNTMATNYFFKIF